MTEKEDLMYKIIASITHADAPIVFKGALVTKLILSEKKYTEIQRMTKDIDANWIEKSPTLNQIVDTISEAVNEISDNLSVKAVREYGENKSAGLCIYEKESGDKVISIDMDISPCVNDRMYYYGKAVIRGVVADEIIADKLLTISNDTVYKYRTKDIIDLYALMHCVSVNIDSIQEILCRKNKKIGSFDAFYNDKDKIEYAYNKLKGINGKPDFNSVYNYLKNYVKPFTKSVTNMIWIPEQSKWEEDNKSVNFIDKVKEITEWANEVNKKAELEAKNKKKNNHEER